MTVSYARDIKPLFRPSDVNCMDRKGVHLGDYDWMQDPDNAQNVYSKISAGSMPPDGRWPPDRVALFKSWMNGGRQP